MKSIIVMMMGLLIATPMAFADSGEVKKVAKVNAVATKVNQLVGEAIGDAFKMNAVPGNQKGALKPHIFQTAYGLFLKSGREFLVTLPAGSKVKKEALKRIAQTLKSFKALQQTPPAKATIRVITRKQTAAVGAAALVGVGAVGSAAAATNDEPIPNQLLTQVHDFMNIFASEAEIVGWVEDKTGVNLNTDYRVHIGRDEVATVTDRVLAALGGTATQYDPNAPSAAEQR